MGNREHTLEDTVMTSKENVVIQFVMALLKMELSRNLLMANMTRLNLQVTGGILENTILIPEK